MKTLKECFKVVLTGDREASRKAAREVRKLVYSSQSGKDKHEDIKNIINNAFGEYTKIFEAWRKENFVMAISVMYFLHDRESHPDFLFPWLFQLLQHENGNIRHAAVRMIEHELGPLTYHIRFPNRKSDPFHTLSPEQADQVLRGLHSNLESLATNSYKPSYKKYKYIDSLPSGTYKSVQHILGCLDDYCSEIYRPIESEARDEILEWRKEIEQELEEMLKKTNPTSQKATERAGSDFGLEDIKKIIYNEDGQDCLTDIIAMFDVGQGAVELQNIIETINDAWNYFPHKVLGGISPAEKLLEYHKNPHR